MEKMVVIESETHQLANVIKQREDNIHSSNKDDTTNNVPRPEMDEEEIVQDDEVYPLKKKDDSLILVDEVVQDIVDLSGDITALDMDPPTTTEVHITLV